MAPSLMAAPKFSAMLSLLCNTSAADTTMMTAGSVTLACFLPAGNTATCEDAAATLCLEAALGRCLAKLTACLATRPLYCLESKLWER